MEEIEVPIVSLSKKNQKRGKIKKSSAKDSKRPSKLDFIDRNDLSGGIENILLGIGLEKYNDLFSKSKITLQTFLRLNKSDLENLGMTDKKDIQKIVENLQHWNNPHLRLKEGRKKGTSESYNINDDLEIARNVKTELILLQNYCWFLETHLENQKLPDYRINWKESALTYLKAFTETASLQAKILAHKVFNELEDDHLIGKTLKLNNSQLPKELKEKLQKKKPKENLIVFSVVIFGIVSLAVLVKTLLPKT